MERTQYKTVDFENNIFNGHVNDASMFKTMDMTPGCCKIVIFGLKMKKKLWS